MKFHRIALNFKEYHSFANSINFAWPLWLTFSVLFVSVSDEDSDLEAMEIEDNNKSEGKKSTTPEEFLKSPRMDYFAMKMVNMTLSED